MNKLFQSIFIFIISAPATVAVIGAAIYVFYGLNIAGVYATALLSLIIISFLIKNNLNKETNHNLKEIPKNEWLSFALFLISWIIALWFLYSGRSDRAIITPWQVVSSWFFLFYGLGIICIFTLSRYSSKLLAAALVLQSLLLFGVAAVVYRIGYGFDPFIHEAAVKAIEQLGQIKPITPYYLGQYSIITVLHGLTNISLSFWSKILVPGLAALMLPQIIVRWLKNHHGAEKAWGLAAVSLLILPATIFIITTPQNLAYLFLLIVIFWPSPKQTVNERVIVWLCAIAALITQPIAGIPAILLVLADSFQNKKLDKYIYPLIILACATALPFAFYVFTALDSSTAVSLSWPNLKFLSILIPTNPNQENWWLNFIYFFNGLWSLIIFLLALAGAWLTIVKKNLELRRRFFWPAVALVVAAIISSCINFHFLIDYERSDYSERLIITAILFALPLIINAFRELAILIEKSNKVIMISCLLIIVLASVASIYLSYPRFDHYYNSHGYASSKADALAVKWIEENSNNEPYVVLANQQVSAAALQEYGFKTYYKDNIFYYPIPTGGELYQNFLSMVAKPDLKIIKSTRDLTGVKRVYFVLDSYWWEFPRVAAEAAFIANETKNIGDGQVMVFKFEK
ncbi:MAG: hypothetical protein NTY12_03020 [Candidatus Falkowbacteria bacterium]|nr:hypothetical protein [Candidatus Falkowbacteria bacterium]